MRRLTAEEIECRVGQKTKDGKRYSVLLYKTARTDMAILDEEYGSMNWKCDYQMVGNSLFCTISVWDKDKNEWISKQSNGSESNVEAEKGQASDALKRSGFLFGIGRELYSAPQIWIDSDVSPYDLVISEIGYDDNGKINVLKIAAKDEVVYELGKFVKRKVPEVPKPELSQRERDLADEVNIKIALKNKLEKINVDLKDVAMFFKKKSWSDLTVQELTKACEMKGV